LRRHILEHLAAAAADPSARRAAAGGLVASARALAHVLRDKHVRSNDAAGVGLLRRSIAAHFPRLAVIANGGGHVGGGAAAAAAAVGQCNLTLSKPVTKAPLVSALETTT